MVQLDILSLPLVQKRK